MKEEDIVDVSTKLPRANTKKNMKNIITIVALCISFGSWAQMDTVALKYAATIKAEDLRTHLEELASDEYEGRETGKKGQKMAADYIAAYFKTLGIQPVVDGSYYQTFPLKTESSEGSALRLNKEEYEFIKDFFFWPGFDGSILSTTEVVFVGYGISTDEYDDYNGVDVKDKVIMVLDGEPFDKSGNSMITGSDRISDWSSDWRVKRTLAQEKGAKAMVFVKNNYDSYVGRVKYYLQTPGMRLNYEEARGEEVLPTFFIRPEIAEKMIDKAGGKSLAKTKAKITKKGKSVSDVLSTDLTIDAQRNVEHYQSENVLGFIEGSDDKLKEEVVVITAHYDHVGIINGEIHNGADDDGSGTCTALELAEAFKKAQDDGHGPKRSVLIMTVSGEEKGLLGSEWYSEYPIFPLENTVVDLNIDMIGRVDEAHADDENYIYLIGADKLSTELHAISEEANSTYTNLALDYTYNDPNDPNRFYYRSDHYNFAKHGIPVIFYFSGVHEDYHKPGDDADKIMYDKTAKIGRLIFHTAWELANRDARIVVDVENDFEDVD